MYMFVILANLIYAKTFVKKIIPKPLRFLHQVKETRLKNA